MEAGRGVDAAPFRLFQNFEKGIDFNDAETSQKVLHVSNASFALIIFIIINIIILVDF